MFKARTILLLISAVLIISLLSSLGFCNKSSGSNAIAHSGNKTTNSFIKKLETKAAAAKAFVTANKYNDKVCFLIDMSLPSGQNRFFIYDLENDTVSKAGLVTHGNCNQYWLDGRKYGNTVGCGCTSLGKYKVGYPYVGVFGQAFKLYGLDKTNNMAFDRFVVLHSHSCVPETTVKDEICQSNGCPTVAPGFLATLRPIINQSRKPVLLWIFE
ncbi:MAG: murein L,D-transpeptidase catalytic domain-containing protein [Chitinophagaceae bacterium]